MSIEQAVHERWQSYRPLVDLVPVDRVLTGWVPPLDSSDDNMALPYVSMTREGETEVLTPSGGVTLTTVTLRIDIWGATLTAVKNIAKRIQTRYGGSDYTYSEGSVLLMREAGLAESRTEDGTWLCSLTYNTSVQT